jgi:SAM-dependent methyltransferase
MYKFLASLIKSEGLRHALGFEQTIWTRKVQDRETRKLVEQLNPSALDALEISGEIWKDFGFQSYRNVRYPEFDLCRDVLSEKFDLIIAEHILEHVLYPYRAANNIHSMLRAGGHALIVTPFIYRVHPTPHDNTRWTMEGLEYFLSECGFENIVTGSWGNRKCIEATFRREFRLFNRHFHSLENEPEYPIVVWALAAKQLSGK